MRPISQPLTPECRSEPLPFRQSMLPSLSATAECLCIRLRCRLGNAQRLRNGCDVTHEDLSRGLTMDQFIGQAASVLLARYRLTRDNVTLYDEPPGKLRGFSFTPTDRPSGVIWVGLEYDRSSLFSLTRTWSWESISQSIANYCSDRHWSAPRE